MDAEPDQHDYETLTYILDMLCQLKMMAQSSRKELLSYTIGLAVLEANRAVNHSSWNERGEINRETLYFPEQVE